MFLFWVKKVRQKEVKQQQKNPATMKVTNYCKMEQRQRYNGPGKKNNASTNKYKKKDCKTNLKAKSRLDKKKMTKYNSRTN
jgi:hypothetical protein